MPLLTLLVMTIGCSLLFGWVGQRTLNNRKVGAIGGAVLGVVLSFQTPVQRMIEGPPPRPELTIDVPADFKQEQIILITDPSVDTEIHWDERTNEARIKTPKSGVIRLKSLGRLDNQITHAKLSSGKTNWGLTNTNVHGERVVAYGFNYDFRTQPDLGLLSENELAELIRKREAE